MDNYTGEGLTLKEIQKVLISFVENNIHIPLLIWGKQGVGKSAIVKSLEKALPGYKVLDIRLSQKESVDIAGMPHTAEIKINGKPYNVLDFHPPRWFLESLLEGKCILFFDELNRAKEEVIQSIFELIYDRRLNGHKLPETVFMCSACNPADDNFDVRDLADAALKDRFLHVIANPSKKEWLDWAKKEKIHPNVINFAKEEDQAFGKPLNFTLKELDLESSSRTLERASQIENLELSDNIKISLYQGLFGEEGGIQYWKSSKANEDRVITLEDLEELSDVSKKRIEKYCNTKNIEGQDIRLDLLKKTCLLIEENPKVWFSYYKNVIYFLSKIPLSLSHNSLDVLYHKLENGDEKTQEIISYLVKQEFVEEIKKLNSDSLKED